MSGEVTVEYIDSDESWSIFDSAAERLLGVSGERFVADWDAGSYSDSDEIEVMQVAMLRPSGR